MTNKQIISLLSLHFIQEILILKGLKMRFNIQQGRGIGRGGCSSRGRGSSWVFPPHNFLSFPQLSQFLDAQASLAPTHVRVSVRWSVRHTFGFPIS